MLNETANEPLHSPLRVTHVGDCDGGSGFGMVGFNFTKLKPFLSLAPLLLLCFGSQPKHSQSFTKLSFFTGQSREPKEEEEVSVCFKNKNPTLVFTNTHGRLWLVLLHHMQKHCTKHNQICLPLCISLSNKGCYVSALDWTRENGAHIYIICIYTP